MNLLNRLFAYLASIYTKEPTMATTTTEPTVDTPTTATVDTNKLKALLVALGHDIEAEWEHLVALAKKAL
ncbi:hypothetical protein [Pseudomonas bohemica]|uniref:hypothetical protein n=1 Tax=Pseudomonas bohemica TaxID=2044872 RepID=UPI000DA621B2|nr:hypothetical protein [Pseudomonas bohemica]